MLAGERKAKQRVNLSRAQSVSQRHAERHAERGSALLARIAQRLSCEFGLPRSLALRRLQQIAVSAQPHSAARLT